MLVFLIPLVISSLLGFLAGMGVGGGSLLLLWLTQIVNMPQADARILNLLFYLPAALAATLFQVKAHNIRKDIVIPALIAGCITAIGFSVLSRYIELNTAKKLLGGLLVVTGFREIFYRPRKAR